MFKELSLLTGRGSRCSSGPIGTSAIVRTLGSDLQLEERVVCSVSFNFGSRQVTDLFVNGVDQLTGNGIYLIASKGGEDNTPTNYFSVYGQSRMAQPPGPRSDQNGPGYSLTFRQIAPNKLSFRASVTANDNYATVSMPFDFVKQNMSHFAFNGNRYRLENSVPGGTRNGSGAAYSSIPTGGAPIPGNGGYVGVAVVDGAVSWGEVTGNLATVRVNISRSSHYTSLKFHNHPGTNNLELSFGRMRRGETAMVEGEVIVTPKGFTGLRLEAESSAFGHQTGRVENNSYSARVGDAPNRFMVFGPSQVSVPSGTRTAKFRLKLDNVSADNNNILRIEVWNRANGQTLKSQILRRRVFTTANAYQNFSLNFNATAGQQLEFRVFWYGGSYAALDYVDVT